MLTRHMPRTESNSAALLHRFVRNHEDPNLTPTSSPTEHLLHLRNVASPRLLIRNNDAAGEAQEARFLSRQARTSGSRQCTSEYVCCDTFRYLSAQWDRSTERNCDSFKYSTYPLVSTANNDSNQQHEFSIFVGQGHQRLHAVPRGARNAEGYYQWGGGDQWDPF